MRKYDYSTMYQVTDPGEKVTQPSMTVPNEAMSIREILVRYSRGLPIDAKVPIYDEENDLPDPKKMDLADWEEMQIAARQEVKRIKEKHEKEMSEKKAEAEKRKSEYQKFQEFLKSQSTQQSTQQPTQ